MRLRLLTALGFVALAVGFWVANRGAYKSWFMDDDLDNIAWTSAAGPATFATGLVSPKFYTQNFRPLGHLYWFAMERAFGTYYPAYAAVIHIAHLLNVVLLWLVLRRLNFSQSAAWAGAILFAFHMAVFDAYWRPMYIFDVLCGTFSLLTLLAYMSGAIIPAAVCLWLAYKAKELAVLLPLALLAYEYWFADRRWKRLIPLFAISALFGIQSLLFNQNVNNDYTFRFHWWTIRKTILWYSSQVFFAPYLGLALIPLALIRDRKLRFGLLFFGILLIPMLLLPNRLFAAYLYIPLIGIAIVLAALTDKLPKPWWIAALFLVWLPLNYSILKDKRRPELARADEFRQYFTALAEAAPKLSAVNTVIYEGEPKAMREWGVQGALQYLLQRPIKVQTINAVDLTNTVKSDRLALVSYEPAEKKIYTVTRTPESGEASYITMNRETPFWQLEYGWFGREGRYRWTRPRAILHLNRPAEASQLEFTANIGPGLLETTPAIKVDLTMADKPLGTVSFTKTGWQTVSLPVPASEPGIVRIELRTTPAFHPANDPRDLGIPIGAIGFK